ncbi:MAG: hypothetical protein H7327_01900, partial [Herminiimonas sp.]|nr:hypothetical protein [Herminiimonas sp.]
PSMPIPAAITKAPSEPIYREPVATTVTIQPEVPGKPVLREAVAKAVVMQPKAPGKPVLREPVAKAVAMQSKARPTVQAERLRSFTDTPLRLTMSTVLGTTMDHSVVALATVRQPNARQR